MNLNLVRDAGRSGPVHVGEALVGILIGVRCVALTDYENVDGCIVHVL
jgi:hypothetical protein